MQASKNQRLVEAWNGNGMTTQPTDNSLNTLCGHTSEELTQPA
jgi:hypothetical protein